MMILSPAQMFLFLKLCTSGVWKILFSFSPINAVLGSSLPTVPEIIISKVASVISPLYAFEMMLFQSLFIFP